VIKTFIPDWFFRREKEIIYCSSTVGRENSGFSRRGFEKKRGLEFF